MSGVPAPREFLLPRRMKRSRFRRSVSRLEPPRGGEEYAGDTFCRRSFRENIRRSEGEAASYKKWYTHRDLNPKPSGP